MMNSTIDGAPLLAGALDEAAEFVRGWEDALNRRPQEAGASDLYRAGYIVGS